jgi:Na+-transporting NADH:ubiquinone oxidoreductase subunit A
MIHIKCGLDLPIDGIPTGAADVSPAIQPGAEPLTVALLGDDYVGLKPTMAVQVGDSVKQGQLLFTDKKTPGVRFTSPACGKVIAVNRGARRAFQSLVIERAGDDEVEFKSYASDALDGLGRDAVRENLIESGLWTALRTRPFSRIPAPDTVPNSIFVTAIDTNPLAVKPEVVIDENQPQFEAGLRVMRQLTDGRLFVVRSADCAGAEAELDFVTSAEFVGPHPAGLPGTHIHFLDPVHENKTVWHVNYQDVIAIGSLFLSGRLPVDRVISVAGPAVQEPCLVRTRLGACVSGLMTERLKEGDTRVISGSVLSGRIADGPFDYLGRYHLQISALSEGRERKLFGWLTPGRDIFSIKRIVASRWFNQPERFAFTTSLQGSERSMVPIGMYEDVMPLDIEPTFLLRALIVEDIEDAIQLGCLELDEEDLALCTFVCPSKYEFGPILRRNLTRIEKEG